MPINTLSSITHPCTIALCPMLTLFPTTVFALSYVQCIIAPSCTFTLLPSRILFTSPLITALNQMLQSFPITTSPAIVALGAIKQLFPNCGSTPFTERIKLIFYFFWLPTSVLWSSSLCHSLVLFQHYSASIFPVSYTHLRAHETDS